MFYFFFIVIIVYCAIHFYLYKRVIFFIKRFLPLYKKYFILIFYTIVIGFPFFKITNYFFSSDIIQLGDFIFSFYPAYLFYLLIGMFVFEVSLLIIRLPFFARFYHYCKNNEKRIKKKIFSLMSILPLLFSLYGYWNAFSLTIQNISLPFPLKHQKQFKIVFLSDLHLGKLISPHYFSKIVRKINELNPDLILLGGDTIDRNIEEVKNKKEYEESFLALKAKYGIYAVSGNHDYYAHIEEVRQYLKQMNIHLLEDQSVLIADSFYLVGRKDKHSEKWNGEKRLELSTLLKDISPHYPVILLDHQPYDLNEATQHKIFLQLSGHTHKGQFFPFNWVIDLLYEKSYGYYKKQDTHFYISSGVGIAVSPVRTSGQSEIIEIILFSEK